MQKYLHIGENSGIIIISYAIYEIKVRSLTKRRVDKVKCKARKISYFLALVIVIMCTFSSTVIASASWFEKNEIPIPTVKNDVYVYDDGNIIDDDIEKQLNSLLITLEEKTTILMAGADKVKQLEKENHHQLRQCDTLWKKNQIRVF